MTEQRQPEQGQEYWPFFEYELPKEGDAPLLIETFDSEYDDGGFEITANDGIGYDCYWSEKHECWCYGL